MNPKSVTYLFLVLAAYAAFFNLGCAHRAKTEPIEKPAAQEPAVATTEAPAVLAKASVILVGETHYYTPFESYEYLLSAVAPVAQLCVAVELPVSSGTFENTLQNLRKRESEVKKQNGSGEAVRRTHRVLETYTRFSEMSTQLQIKIYGVDDAHHYKSALDVESRSRSMARNILQLLKSGQCGRVMAILGKAHLTFGSQRKLTVKGLLTEARVDSVSVNLQMTNEENVPGVYQSFKGSGLSASPTDYEWLENKLVKRMIRLLPNLHGDNSVWQEFDYTLLLPYNLKASVLD